MLTQRYTGEFQCSYHALDCDTLDRNAIPHDAAHINTSRAVVFRLVDSKMKQHLVLIKNEEKYIDGQRCAGLEIHLYAGKQRTA